MNYDTATTPTVFTLELPNSTDSSLRAMARENVSNYVRKGERREEIAGALRTKLQMARAIAEDSTVDKGALNALLTNFIIQLSLIDELMRNN